MVMKMRLKWKKDKKIYHLGLEVDANVIKYKVCLSIMIVICIKQHLSNVWSSIHANVSNTEAELKKKKKTLPVKKARSIGSFSRI